MIYYNQNIVLSFVHKKYRYFIMNKLLATIGPTQPHLCILSFDETLLNVTDIAMTLHLISIFFDVKIIIIETNNST